MAVQTVQAVINGQTYSLTYNSTSGKWEGTITAPNTTSYNTNAGHYYPVIITATNSAGTTTTKNDTDSVLGNNLKLIVKETIKPTIVMQSPTSGSKLTTGKPTVSFRLRDEVNGSGINLQSLRLRIDSGSNVLYNSTGMTCTSVSGGYDCSYICQTTLGDGSHTIYIDIADNDGNTATQCVTTFQNDTIPPELVISNPQEGLVTNNSSLTINGQTSDLGSSPVTVTIKVNGVDQGVVNIVNGNFSKGVTLGNGNNAIIVRATDNSGLYSEITRTVQLDTTAPVISNVYISENPTSTGNVITITVTVTG